MKSLAGTYLRKWLTAFDEEKSLPWVLPKDKRTYFLTGPYMVGINCSKPTALNMSSFARVGDRQPTDSCAKRLMVLFEERLFPMCREQGKNEIVATLTTESGIQAFKDLKGLMPGIELLSGPRWVARVPVPHRGRRVGG